MAEPFAIIDGWPNGSLYRYMRTVCRRLARGRRWLDPDDLLHTVCLHMATRRPFDPARLKPSTFAAHRCAWGLTEALAKRRRRPDAFLHPSPIGDGVDPAGGRFPDPAEAAERRELVGLVGPLVASLPEPYRAAVARRYGLGGSDPAVLKDCLPGRTRERARQVVRDALLRLRRDSDLPLTG